MNRFVDTERVIECVRNRPLLWDATHTAYKSFERRAQTWIEIAQEMYGDELSQEDIYTMSKYIQQRWKTARDAYVKDTSKVNKSRNKKKYIHTRLLTFLGDGSGGGGGGGGGGKESGEESAAAAERASGGSGGEAEVWIRSDGSDAAPDPADERDALALAPEPRRRKRRLKREPSAGAGAGADCGEQLLPAPAKAESELEADDMAFFSSLAPILEKFSWQQKLQFRHRVLGAAINISTKSDDDE